MEENNFLSHSHFCHILRTD